ncbi:MAG: STAS domain-containing protein [Bryobacter sp.]|jgi:anti-anti-sigma factor|nr:STAS domain-containing protein [Bryobacter sp. CoA8 C33]
MPLKLQLDRVGSTLLITVSGDFILGQPLRNVSQAIRDAAAVKGFVIDLSLCSRVDSSGLGELLLCYSLATREHKKLLLTGASGYIRETMRIARVDTVLLSASTREAALALVEP